VIAGGVVTTLLDHSCGQAVMAAMGAPAPIATLDLRIDYMRAAEPGLGIQARAHCYKVTHSIAFVRATAYDKDIDDPVATAQATFMFTGPAETPPAETGA
jgi:acyl-coenzyme A thioesterase PaaI-like protein